jgi:hypothetical protein
MIPILLVYLLLFNFRTDLLPPVFGNALSPLHPLLLLFFFFLPLSLSIKSIGDDVVDIVDLGAEKVVLGADIVVFGAGIVVFGAAINFGAAADIAAFGADVIDNFFLSNSAMINFLSF